MVPRLLSVAVAVGLSASAAHAQTVSSLFPGPQPRPSSRLADEGLGYTVVYPPTSARPGAFRVQLVCFGGGGHKSIFCPSTSHAGSCLPTVSTLACR